MAKVTFLDYTHIGVFSYHFWRFKYARTHELDDIISQTVVILQINALHVHNYEYLHTYVWLYFLLTWYRLHSVFL